jgi:hypothetical protein
MRPELNLDLLAFKKGIRDFCKRFYKQVLLAKQDSQFIKQAKTIRQQT